MAKSSGQKSKHTPGPWKVHRSYSSGLMSLALAGELPNYVPIETPFKEGAFADATSGDSPWEPSEIEANARLIAAAPEMLEALEEFIRFIDLPPWAQPNEIACYRAAAVASAEAAIAKAKGETRDDD